jgi:predicted nucleic acid-binding protein
MSSFLDTSVVVRYLTGDPPRLAAQAAAIIDAGEPLSLTDVVVAETACVLASVYGVPRDALVDSLIDLLQKRNVAVSGLDKGTVIQALMLARPSKRVSFADAMVWAAARSADAPVYSLDERFPTDGIQVRRGRP